MVDCFFGLKTLELGSERFIDGDIAFSPSESLVSLILGDLNYFGFIELLKSTPTPFPNLKNLSMSGRTKEWEVDELELLPGTLESLEIGLVRNGAVLPHLPSSLTSLTLHATEAEEAFCEAISCPPNLVKLGLRFSEMDQCEGDFKAFVASLPRQMEWLEIVGFVRGMDFISDLPPALKHWRGWISLQDDNEVCELARLQETVPLLTHLDISFGQFVPLSVLNYLSQSLKHVSLGLLEHDSVEMVSFPPNARNIHLPETWFAEASQEVIVAAIRTLPQTLTTLSLLQFEPKQWTDLAIQALPKTLNTLHLVIVEESHVKHLPSKLTRLQLGGYGSPVLQISNAALLQLPTSLTYLELYRLFPPPFQSGWTLRLSALKTLLVFGLQPIDHSDLSALPQSLTGLHLLWVQAYLKQPTFPGKEAWVAAMSHLNNITELVIRGEFSDPDIIYGLANKNRLNPLRSLTLQSIAPARPLTDEHLAATNLKLLTHLSLDGACSCTRQSLKFLPRPPCDIDLPEGFDFPEIATFKSHIGCVISMSSGSLSDSPYVSDE
jgi:hypothetical protein